MEIPINFYKYNQLLGYIENIGANREIAHSEQFPLLQQCFQKSSPADVSECARRKILYHLTATVTHILTYTYANSKVSGKLYLSRLYIIYQEGKDAMS